MLKEITKIITAFLICVLMASKILAYDHKSLAVPKNMILPIGVKIWTNESGGTFSGMLSWNDGEDFLSLGIGHFVWRPRGSGASSFDDFPQLLKYLEKRGINIPLWLTGDNAIYCPWNNKEEFLHAQALRSPQFIELRNLLLSTIPVQAEYMTIRLENVLPKMLSSVPPNERPYVCQKFYGLAQTSGGTYALADYLNFKGSGANRNFYSGCGLLQVLEEMRFAPQELPLLEQFTWAAKALLEQHVLLRHTRYNEELWIKGWLNRIDNYLPKKRHANFE